MIEILSHRINQDWVLDPATWESVPHQTHPPRPSIHALTDAIVRVCAWVMSISLVESCLDLRRTECQAHSSSLLTVLFSNRGPNPQQGVLHIPQHPAQWSSHSWEHKDAKEEFPLKAQLRTCGAVFFSLTLGLLCFVVIKLLKIYKDPIFNV